MSTHIKIENQTEVPVLVALFEQPKCNDHPTRSAVLKPGESCDWGSIGGEAIGPLVSRSFAFHGRTLNAVIGHCLRPKDSHLFRLLDP